MSKVLKKIKKHEFVLIAEIGVNYYDIAKKLHVPLLDAAKAMILAACNAGIDAVKFQSYKADTLASVNSPAYWDTSEEKTKSQYELFKKFDVFGEQEYQHLAEYSQQIGIEFCSTPFDFDSADYLDKMMDFYKISSSDLTNLPFVAYIAKKNKPILLSVGASNVDEIETTVNLIKQYNQQPLVLLHCVLEYPTPYAHANLKKIKTLQEHFPDAYICYSDHTKPDANYEVLKTAYAMGARVIEKHFTLDKKLQGNDHYHAMDPHDAEQIIKGLTFIEQISGQGELKCLDSELKARANARRSIVLKKALKKGAVIRKEDLTYKRPGSGISPKDEAKVIGKKVMRDIPADSILSWSDLL